MAFVVFSPPSHKRGGMAPPSSPFPPIQLFCFDLLLFFLFPSLSNGRLQPWLAPSSPLLHPDVQPISSPPMLVAPSPTVMQIAVAVRHHHLNKDLIIALSLATTAITVIICTIFAWIFWRRNRRDPGSKDAQSYGVEYASNGLPSGPLSKFNSFRMMNKKPLVPMIEYSSLVSATDSFSENNILANEGLGCVYKSCLYGRVLAAVKKLDGNGQEFERNFDNELDLLGKIRHPNIVSVLGYCIHGESRFLVYELLQNGSLEEQLHGPSYGAALTWHLRMKIALDAARGLEYLHEHCYPPVIHRDLKSSNILLDTEFNAKIADFGLAASGGTDKGSFKLSGTFGHVAPEYILDGKLSEKSDVYAFGIVLLELLIGRKPVEKMAPSQCQSIVTWAMPQLTDRLKLPSIIHPVIRDTMDLKHLYQVAAVAVLCIQPEPSYRPLITDVLHSLIPLVPVELGGTLRLPDRTPQRNQIPSIHLS